MKSRQPNAHAMMSSTTRASRPEMVLQKAPTADPAPCRGARPATAERSSAASFWEVYTRVVYSPQLSLSNGGMNSYEEATRSKCSSPAGSCPAAVSSASRRDQSASTAEAESST